MRFSEDVRFQSRPKTLICHQNFSLSHFSGGEFDDEILIVRVRTEEEIGMDECRESKGYINCNSVFGIFFLSKGREGKG